MSERLRAVLWYGFVVAVGAALSWAYYRYVWMQPDSFFEWTRGEQKYELLQPRILGLVLVAPALLFILGKSLADLPWQQRVLSVLLRTAFIALLALSLARLARTSETQKVATVYVVDVSDSVPDEALADARAALERAIEAKPEEDVLRVVTFAKRPRLLDLKSDGGKLAVPPVRELRHRASPGSQPASAKDEGEEEEKEKASPAALDKPGAGSDLQAALQLAYGVFPPGYL